MKPKYTVYYILPTTHSLRFLRITCPCGTRVDFNLDHLLYDKWRRGALIQNCFPEMNPADREMLISGHCEACFDNLLGE